MGDVTARLGTLVRVREGYEREQMVDEWGKPPLAGEVHCWEDSRRGLGLKNMQGVICIVP